MRMVATFGGYGRDSKPTGMSNTNVSERVTIYSYIFRIEPIRLRLRIREESQPVKNSQSQPAFSISQPAKLVNSTELWLYLTVNQDGEWVDGWTPCNFSYS